MNTNTVLSPALIWSLVFSFVLLANVFTKWWLASRQMRHVLQHRAQVPADFAEKISLSAHQKAADYTITKTRFSTIALFFEAVLLLIWTLFGGLDFLNQSIYSAMNLAANSGYGSRLWAQLMLFLAFSVIGGILDLPFTLYSIFVIEERFGFNKTTFKLWLIDLLKSTVVGCVIGLPLMALILWLMNSAGSWWWFYAWAFWVGFSLLMMVIYPTWIAPIFNQFKPLEDETLKERVTDLMQRCGFTSKGLFVMDGSRRSAHSNAYFTGFGAAKRVVFYDTLLKQLNMDEVDAVLAHELGHFKHRHITKRMIQIFVFSLLGFALLGFLHGQTWFYAGLGVTPHLMHSNDALALLLFTMVLPLFMFFVSPLMSQGSRKDEFQADAYAVKHSNGAALAQALLKMYEDNASTLTPDPIFTRFYASHPPAFERISRIEQEMQAQKR